MQIKIIMSQVNVGEAVLHKQGKNMWDGERGQKEWEAGRKEEGTAVTRQGQELGEERVKVQEQNQINQSRAKEVLALEQRVMCVRNNRLGGGGVGVETQGWELEDKKQGFSQKLASEGQMGPFL